MILPRFIKKFLAILRGGVSPVFIFLSVMLGFSFGLMPGFSGFHTVIIILVLVLNVHAGLFLLSAGIGKTLCFAAAPVLYHTGAWIQTYLSFLLRLLASVPVIAMTNFSRYSVAGAVILGPVLGAIAGLLMARSVISFRRMLLKFEDGSDKFKKWYSNRWVRILDRLLIGKRTKDAKSLFTAKTRYVRKAGVALAVLLLAASAIATTLIKDSTIKDYASAAMTRANGAEVSLDDLGLSVLTGAVSVSGIDVTDPENPNNNQLTIDKVAADASVYNLLLGRVVMEKVEVSNVKFNQKRSAPGKVDETTTKQEPAVFDPCNFKVDPADLTKLQTYLKDAKALKEKLRKLRQWLPKKDAEKTATQPKQVPQKYLDYLKAQAVMPATPRILAKKVILNNVQIPSPTFGNSKVLLTNLSDAPRAAKLPVTFDIKSLDTSAFITVTIDYGSKDRVPKLSGSFGGFDMAKIQSSLSENAGLIFASGTASGQFNGIATNELVDITADIAISNLQAKGQGKGVLGLGSKTTSEAFGVLTDLKTTIRIVGPPSEPRLLFDVKQLTDELKKALVKAGKDRLIKEIDDQLGKQLDGKVGDKVPDEIKDILKPKKIIEGLKGLLGGKKDEGDK
ncbi:MAG: hypothetical protein FVQ85_06650 [Planctomycetes bacterium]|nr:hypothetical protein [Planctomycetota bacterium]